MKKNKRIIELENAIRERDELIYAMIRNTHNFQSFMLDKSIDIKKLREKFAVDVCAKVQPGIDRIKLLGKDIFG